MLSSFLGVLAALVVMRQLDQGHIAAALLDGLAVVGVCGLIDAIVWAARRVAGGRGVGQGKP
jgi:hypothetical protein